MLDTELSPPREIVTLPSDGEALITVKMFAAALGVSESTVWDWAKTDPLFPPLVRRGERFTRVRLTQAREYIAGMSAGVAKLGPAKHAKLPAAAK